MTRRRVIGLLAAAFLLAASVPAWSFLEQNAGGFKYGSTASGGNLTLFSTTNPTKGKVIFGAAATSAYDEVNDRLGIGTSSPSNKLHIKGSAAEVQSDGTLTTIAYGTNASIDDLWLAAAEGTIGSPTVMLTGHTIGSVNFVGWDGSFFGQSGRIQGQTTENWSTTNHGGQIIFSTIPNGVSGALTNRMTIANGGSVLIGTGTAAAGSQLRVIGGDVETDNQFMSTVATGMAPLVVASATVVPNLNINIGGDVTGTTAASTVASINGTTAAALAGMVRSFAHAQLGGAM